MTTRTDIRVNLEKLSRDFNKQDRVNFTIFVMILAFLIGFIVFIDVMEANKSSSHYQRRGIQSIK